MPMHAIKVSEKTMDKLQFSLWSISKFDVAAMVNENPRGLYFIPEWSESLDANWAVRWALVPPDFFEEHFEYDKDKIETELVRITRK